jgi:hypothetical protein
MATYDINANIKCVDPSLVEILDVSGGVHTGTYSLASDGLLHLDGSINLHAITEADLDITGVTYTIKIRDDGSITSINNETFLNCRGLTSLIFPDSVTTIGNNACFNCTALNSITFGISLESIGSFAFRACSVTSITFPDGFINIGGSAFLLCKQLTSITFPNSVTSIGGSAFSSCTGLTSITFNLSDPGIYTQINNVSKLPTNVTYELNAFKDVPPQNVKYVVAVEGCTNHTAINYDPLATIDDGSCEYKSGCTDPSANNYDPLATIDDESCEYKSGCTNPAANNYDPSANVDDGSCLIVGYADGVLRLDVR